MKKILTILAILMVAVVGRTYADDDVVWTEVSTADQFYSVIKNNHSANVKLTADIDLSSHKASDDCIFNFGFSGKITGLYTVDETTTDCHKLMNSKNDLLFNYLEGAEITNLYIYNCSFDGWDTHSGWFATEAKNSKFADIKLVNCSGNGDNALFDNDCMGGLLGSAKNCEFIAIYSINSSITTDGERAGLIVGKDQGSTFFNCMTGPTSSIWADGNANNAYCGGLCGDATGSTFTDCINMALVTSKDDRTGGVIGFGSNTKLTRCTNSGIVCNMSKDAYKTMKSNLAAQITSGVGLGGGVLASLGYGLASTYHLGWVAPNLYNYNSFFTCVWEFMRHGAANFGTKMINGVECGTKLSSSVVTYGYGTYFAAALFTVAVTALVSYGMYYDLYAADEIGGVAGKLDNGSIADKCINLGGVECDDVECGGIVGYLDGSTVQNCLNRGLVKGENRTGGIAGYCNNNSVLNGNINLSGFNALGGDGGYIYDEGDHGDLTATNNYYVAGSTTTNSNGCIGETTENFAKGSVALALNEAMNDTIWHQKLGEDMYPIPQANAPLVTAATNKPATVEKVASPGDFIIAVSNPYAVVSLEADLDMSGVQCVDLSTEETPFRGKIYGNGHKLSNFSYEVPLCTDDNSTSNAAMFSFANGAEFHNLTIENFHYTQKDMPTFNYDNKPQRVEALLVANSTECKYDSIAIKNSSIEKKNTLRWVGGVVAKSNNDTFTNCSADGNCLFQAMTSTTMDDALLGSIAGLANGSTFSYCYSAASLWSDDNRVGGIVGELEDGSIDHCFNSGTINSHERVGGIVGFAKNTSVTYCSNTGLLADGKDTRQDWRGGIIGRLEGSSASKAYNLNFGTLNYMASKCEAIGKLDDNAVDGGHNYYYCQYNGNHSDNESSYTEENNLYRYAKMLSGEFACNAVDANGKAWVYQDIDNNTFGTHMPTPIPAAGVVYSNILCDGTQSYSNKYKSTGAHTGTADQFGYCTTCGAKLGDANTNIHITDSLELIQFAYNVNKGADFSGSTVYLDKDINLYHCDFPIIGRYATAPFRGTFDGQGHRIKNMTLSIAEGGIGLFGVVSGTSTIKNVVIDATCSVASTSGAGVAGLVGSVKPYNGTAANVTIENCGNEASVTGVENVAGLLGGVYENDGNVVNINNCYNTGAISGNSETESGSIVGYARKHTSISNTYNSGTVGGTTDWLTFAYTGADGFDGTITNCYTTVSGDKTSNVTKISLFPVESGDLCKLLNQSGKFAQTVGTDAYPVPGTAGLTGEPDSYWKEVSTADEFKEAVDMTNIDCGYPARIRLTADIDISNLSPISSGDEEGYLFYTNYGGIIDGNSHTLSGNVNPLFYRTSQATIKDLTLDGFNIVNKTSAIARTSYATNFSNITVKSSSITATSSNNFGFIVGYSSSDNISYCTVESDCYITANRQRIGGIVGEMFGGEISYCRNSATITADADDIGGIVGKSGDKDDGAAAIEYCLNTGTINGDDQCGGIVGYYRKGTITNCVNTGTITSKDGDNHDNQGGIAGKISNANCNNSINFGSVVKCKSQNSQFAIYGGKDGTITATGNEYYCDVKGKHFDTGMAYDDIMSGKYALSKDWLYQDIDNGTFTATAYPVPLPEAGKVYSNILCDGTQSYSNIYKSTDEHKSELDASFICQICGNNVGTGNIHIKTAALLCEFANAVNNGKNYSGSTIYLDNDIDMSGVTNYTPIGTLEHPYIGTFNGQGHRIMNMTVSREGNYAGLFGVVAGENTIIKNTIIDSSCSVTSTASAVGGLVGGVNPTNSGLTTCKVTIENCGNEGSVTATEDAGGVIGGVYGQDYSVLVINNSYNSGAVKSTNKQGATLCGYARKNYTFTNCYNSGTIDGYEDSSKPFFRFNTGGTTSVVNCYDIYVGQTGVANVTADQVASGELCSMLNKDSVVFTQVVGTETITHPVPGTAGLVVSSAVHITNASELTKWAGYVNLGVDYSNSTIYLDNDIDMSDVTNYTPIGSSSHPFSGTFDGQGHRIKNLAISQNKQYTGFFGYVSGNGTIIRNVIIDSSCSVTAGNTNATGAAVAGLIGGVNSASGTTCNVTIENCGNEADITGYSNVAGILGGSYANNNNFITINHCYNTGAITAVAESATLCGYTRKNYTITNCYNSGTLTGGTSDQCFYRFNTGGTASVDSCYDANGSQTGVTQITAAKVGSGELCFLLNGNKAAGVWGHTCDDAHPVLSGAGMQHYSRTMSNRWGTICLPFATKTGDDYDFYELSSVTADALTLKKIEGTLAAGEPAIVYRSSSATGIDMSAVSTTFVDAPVTGSSANGLTLTGTFTSKNISGIDGYFISNNAFWNISGSSNLYCDPFRAYIAGTLSNGAKMLTIGICDDTTAVDALNAITEGEAEYYDLSGHKLNNLQKGVNVVKFSNGVTKKIIIK